MVAPSRSSTIWGLWARASPLTNSAANVAAARRTVRIIKFWIFICPPLQLFSHRGIEVLNVQFYHLIAGAGPGVFDVHARDHLTRGSHGIGRQAQVGVLEYGIAVVESAGVQ